MALSASERIKLIQAIEAPLAEEDWPLIDLTFQQFGLPTEEVWNGTKQGYLLESLKVATDEILIELARHVGLEPERGVQEKVEPTFWESGTFRLFISHLAAHREYVGQLQETLSSYGISAFVAHNDIEPTLEWQAQIETALATCDGLVALLHPEFHSSSWTDQEIGYVMGRGLPTFAVRMGQDPYGFIARFQAFNGNSKTPTALAEELFHSLRTNKQTVTKMAEVLVALFERSGSFSRAKERIGYLEKLEQWHPSFNSRIESAAKNNPQISGSWGVPERVNSLLSRNGVPQF